MAVSNNYEIKNYTLDGIATQFAIPFDVNADDYGNAINIVVYLGLDELELNVDYTISVKTINYPDAVSHTGETLTVFRRTPIEQPVDFVDNGNFSLEDIETGLDRSIMIEQETAANLDNTITAQESANRAEIYKNIAIEKASDAEDWAVGTRSDEQTPLHSLESAKHWAEAADTSASQATSMRNQSAASALVSEGWAKGTQGGVPVESGTYYQDNSKYYKEQAGLSAGAASGSATSAYNSELAAAASEDKAHDWADKATDTEVEPGEYSAKHWASKASISSGSAAVSAYNAGLSETAAGTSETNAGNSATAADTSALKSEGFAVGEQNGIPVSSGSPYYHNSSKYYHDLITQIISGAMRYQGTWTTTGATDYSAIGTPRLKGDMYYCQGTACTIDSVTYTQGDLIIFNQDVADGDTITTSMIDKIDNTETVTPDNLATLTNKTFDRKDNTVKNSPTTVSTTQTITPTKEMNLVIDTASVTLTIGDGSYSGQECVVVAQANSSLVYENGGGTVTISLTAGMRVRLVWNGSYWVATYNALITGTDADGNTIAHDIDVSVQTRGTSDADYSTSEVETGRLWIDGKPIYRKVFQLTTTATSTTLDVSACGIDTVVTSEIKVISSAGSHDISLAPYWIAATDYLNYYMSGNKQNIYIRSGTSYAFGNCTIILEYTKA